jgi:CPA1 family monovalent cation:H+ antiporter
VLVVYGLVPVSNLFSPKIPFRWQHIMVWGGMRGALSLALVLSLGQDFPYRDQLLTMTFGVVAFTIVLQGITIKPLIRLLGIGKNEDDDYSRARVQQIAIASALSELENMASNHLISRPVFKRLHDDLDARYEAANHAVDAIFSENHERLSEEFRMARRRLNVAERSAIEQALHDGTVMGKTATAMMEETDRHYAEPDNAPKETPAKKEH